MNDELKYCKFCGKEKPIKEFCKSGGFIKNICRECQSKKQKDIYSNAKQVKSLQQENQQLIDNWEKLACYIIQEWYCFDNESVEYKVSNSILDKMQELEAKSE